MEAIALTCHDVARELKEMLPRMLRTRQALAGSALLSLAAIMSAMLAATSVLAASDRSVTPIATPTSIDTTPSDCADAPYLCLSSPVPSPPSDSSALQGALFGAAATLGAGVLGALASFILQGKRDLKAAKRALISEIESNADTASGALEVGRILPGAELDDSVYKSTVLTLARALDPELWDEVSALYRYVHGARVEIAGGTSVTALSAVVKQYLKAVSSNSGNILAGLRASDKPRPAVDTRL